MNIYLNLKESCPKDWGNYKHQEQFVFSLIQSDILYLFAYILSVIL